MMRWVALKAEGSSPAEPAKEEQLGWLSKIDKMFFEVQQKKQSYYDIPELATIKKDVAAYYEDRSCSSWRRRLEVMWTPDEYGLFSPELEFVKQGTQMGLLLGLCYGSYGESAKVYRIFLEQNKYTMFQHPREAQRALQDRIVLAMIQGGWRAGWRMGVLAFTFTAVCQSLTVVRQYINPLDFALAGGVMGGVYKLHMGPRGMVGAGLAGSLLGLQSGFMIAGLQLLSGQTVEERWRQEFQVQQETKRLKEEALADKDVRKESVIEVTKPKTNVSINNPNHDPEEEESNEWTRKVIIKLRQWMADVGYTRSPTPILDLDPVNVKIRHDEQSSPAPPTPPTAGFTSEGSLAALGRQSDS